MVPQPRALTASAAAVSRYEPIQGRCDEQRDVKQRGFLPSRRPRRMIQQLSIHRQIGQGLLLDPVLVDRGASQHRGEHLIEDVGVHVEAMRTGGTKKRRRRRRVERGAGHRADFEGFAENYLLMVVPPLGRRFYRRRCCRLRRLRRPPRHEFCKWEGIRSTFSQRNKGDGSNNPPTRVGATEEGGQRQDAAALAMGQTYEQLDKGETGRLGERGKERAPGYVPTSA